MKFVIQRVDHASVTVDCRIVGEIQEGFLVLIGVGEDDTKESADKMVKKNPFQAIEPKKQAGLAM